MTEAADATAQAPVAPSLPSFEQMPLSDDVKRALAEMGYTHPTPVQLATYDPAVRGTDLVVQARTGTGKTAAFGLPLIDQIIKRAVPAVQALILTPTRELALQVSRELERMGSYRGIRTVAVYGGAPMQRQIDALQSGAQVLSGTPGRVLDHLRRGTLSPKYIRALILDEADEMLSMGFEKELHAIVDFLPKERQTLLFSATIPPEIVRMANERLHAPQFLYLSSDNVGALDVMHYVYYVQQDKGDVLLRIVESEDPESAIVFCNTRDETERAAGILTRAGFDADWLNGDLPQSDREKIMARTREGKLRFLVATDVAARGIDISHLTHVINYDFPESPEAYVHRTGRTGRMGRTGTAISLIKPQDIGALYYLRLTYKIRPFEKQLPSAGELKTRAETDIIQMLAQAFSTPAHPDDLALARRLLTHEHCESILAGLLRSHLGDRPKTQEEASAARRARPPRVQEAPLAAEVGTESLAEDDETPSARSMRGRYRNSSRTRGRLADREPVQEAPEVAAPSQAELDALEPVTTPNPGTALESPAPEAVNAAAAVLPPEPAVVVVQPPPMQAPVVPVLPQVEQPVAVAASDPASPSSPMRRYGESEDRGPRFRERTRSRERRDMGLDLPSYEMTPLTDETLEMARQEAGVSDRGHAALANWVPPQEPNDDLPILGTEAGEAEGNVSAVGGEIRPEDQVEVFVNVGRRDGVRPGDFLRALNDVPGISRRDLGRVRIRDRHTFIIVRKEAMERIVEALNGARIGNRIVSAEQARPRDPAMSTE